MAGRYLPAGHGPEPIAGDFYDVLQLEDDLIALLVGDVTGHGVAAVNRMLRLRTAALEYALQQPGPASVLARLDLFMEQGDAESLATLWYGEYRPSTGLLTYGSAGHPPPVLSGHGNPAGLLKLADAPPLGTGLAHALARDHVEQLPPRAILVAYSDGLIERHHADFDEQLALLRDVVDVACDPTRAGTPQTIAAEILHALVPRPDQADDDVCLLVVRRQP